MLTLSSYFKNLRLVKKKTMLDLSKDNHTLVSYLESGKKIRFQSLRQISMKLGVSAEEWQTIKLLWLQQQSGEPLAIDSSFKLKTSQSKSKFLKQVVSLLEKQEPTISRHNLAAVILEILADAAELAALPEFHAFYTKLQK